MTVADDLELVRDNGRLVCDWSVWRNTCEMARAFGWKPSSVKPIRLSLIKLIDNPDGGLVSDEDAQCLARAIHLCIDMLAANQRPTRRRIASLMWFAGKGDFEGDSMLVHLDEPARIAEFCQFGGFRLNYAG